MVAKILALMVIFILLLGSEYLYRKRTIHVEKTRKFTHITVGTFVAFWPFFLSFRAIQWISLFLLVAVLISKKLQLFRSIHAIKRKSWGEALFAIAIGACALLTNNKWVFAAAILHLSIADGLAAIIGKKLGAKYSYKIIGHTKTLAGSAAFWLASVIIVTLTLVQIGATSQIFWPTAFWLPLILTAAENTGIYGLDNLTVPLLAVIFLGPLAW